MCGCKRGGEGKKTEEEALFTCVMQHLESLWDLITEYISEGLTRLKPDIKKIDKLDLFFFTIFVFLLRRNQDQIRSITAYLLVHSQTNVGKTFLVLLRHSFSGLHTFHDVHFSKLSFP